MVSEQQTESPGPEEEAGPGAVLGNAQGPQVAAPGRWLSEPCKPAVSKSFAHALGCSLSPVSAQAFVRRIVFTRETEEEEKKHTQVVLLTRGQMRY